MNPKTRPNSIAPRLLPLAIGALLGVALLACAWTYREIFNSKPTLPVPPAEYDPDLNPLQHLSTLLKDHCTPLPPAKSGEWLSQHDEPGQTLEEYLEEDPIHARGDRRFIYLRLIGDFGVTQQRIVGLTAQALEAYFGLEVKLLPPLLDVSSWPEHARRHHPQWGMPQLLSTYILNRVLAPDLPDDAAVLLGFTSTDLWPGRGWNFVFGQASLRGRVGVWSLARNGNTDGTATEFQLALLRTIKTATHETGHMFSMRHCTAYEWQHVWGRTISKSLTDAQQPSVPNASPNLSGQPASIL